MNWMKNKKIYFSVSGLMIIICLISLVRWGLKLGLDFTGGTLAEYTFSEKIDTTEVIQKLKDNNIDASSIQESQNNTYLFKLPALNEDEKANLKKVLSEKININQTEELRFETVGPSIGPELVKKTMYAIALASASILLWIAYQFKSIKFGSTAIMAMFHDSFILVGAFSLLSHFFGAEIDFLFVTAVLTTLSFSVHDTIVVYDRIRETQKKIGGDLYSVANKAITETMVRSLNNSFTIVFMLFALILLGGPTIKWFAIALFIGTVLGTYSSPFVAVPLLVTWDSISGKIKAKK